MGVAVERLAGRRGPARGGGSVTLPGDSGSPAAAGAVWRRQRGQALCGGEQSMELAGSAAAGMAPGKGGLD